MKNAVKLAANKIDSPKTPGGISKSRLTPIRRLGLSRNVRKSGSSPFISPLSGSYNVCKDVSTSAKDKRKRKEPVEEEVNSDVETKTALKCTIQDGLLDIDESDVISIGNRSEDIFSTPTRSVRLPRKNKSMILTLDNEIESTARKRNVSSPKPELDSKMCSPVSLPNKKRPKILNPENESENIPVKEVTSPQKQKCEAKKSPLVPKLRTKGEDDVIEKYVEVSKPKKTHSRTRKTTKLKEIDENVSDSSEVKVQVHVDATVEDISVKPLVSNNSSPKQEKCPKELTKECIVVLQKKIFKNELKNDLFDRTNKNVATPSQALFDSDSDEVPLSHLNKNKPPVTRDKGNLATLDEDDFIEPNVKVKKLQHKTTSTTGLKTNKKLPQKTQKPKIDTSTQITLNTDQDAAFDDEDDFEIDNKRTILIRRSYDKVAKPSRAKSTGSITQKDIDELKARIEMKKKLLMAKAVNKDTEELRGLIKKWQKGCQDALSELMDLMKMKFPDKRNMDYSEILETLKIPANLVGYDSDNDCFVTPTDEDIILSKLNAL